MPLPYRKLTALMTRYNGSNLLIDCGEGTQVSIREKGWSVHDLDVICFTHYHADHISGLPGLLLTLGNADRTKPVHMIGPKGLERVVNALRTIAPELPFPIEYHEITEKEQDFEMNGYCIHAFRVNHNVTCYGYTLEIKRQGRFDVERARRQEIPQKFWSRLQKGETLEENGRVPIIAECAKHADLFICEGMYAEKEKEAKARQYKHMTFYEAADLAKRAEVTEMWLTHYSPSLTRAESYMDEVHKIFPAASLGKDGRSVELEFEEV